MLLHNSWQANQSIIWVDVNQQLLLKCKSNQFIEPLIFKLFETIRFRENILGIISLFPFETYIKVHQLYPMFII